MPFNPDVPQSTPQDFTGRSRGISVPRGADYGNIFRGLGQTIAAAGRGIDEAIQGNIRQDVREQFEQVQQDYGVNSATDLYGVDIDEQSQPLPEDIQRAGDHLNRLNKAVANGTLRESHFYARLHSITRQMRSRYPGYEDQIDGIVQGVTGVNPANALRRELMQEAQASAASSSKFDKYVDQNQRYLPSDYYQRQHDGDPYTEAETKAFVAQRKQEAFAIEQEAAKLRLQKERGEMQQEDAMKAGRKAVNLHATKVFEDVKSPLGARLKGFRQLSADVLQDQVVSAEEKAQLEQGLRELQVASNQEFEAFLEENGLAGLYSQKEKQELQQEFNSKFKVYADAVMNEEYGLLNAQSRQNEARKDEATGRLLNSNDILPRLQATREIMGSEGLNTVIGSRPEVLDEIAEALLDDSLADAVTNGPGGSLSGRLDLIKKEHGDNPPKGVIRGLVTDRLSVLGSKEASATSKANVIMNTFNDESNPFLNKMKPSERLQVFNMMTRPGMIKQVSALKESHPEAWNTYITWVSRNFRSTSKELVDQLKDLPESIQFTYNADTNSLQFTEATQDLFDEVQNIRDQRLIDPFSSAEGNEGLREQVFSVGDLEGIERANDLISKFNDAVSPMGEIADIQGVDESRTMSAFLKGLGVPLEDEQEALVPPNVAGGTSLQSAVEDVNRQEQESLPDQSGAVTPAPVDLTGGPTPEDLEANARSNIETTGQVPNERVSGAFAQFSERFGPRAQSVSTGLTALSDFIGSVEAPKGYGQVYGGSRVKRDVSKMTVGEVLAFQKEMLRSQRHKPVDQRSSAVGKYQFISKTLRGLIRKHKVPMETPFNKELQDSLALELMKGRGLDRYLDGRLSENQFADNLAKEWASMPNRSGKSAHAGVGTNRALVSRRDFLAKIRALKS